MFDILGKLNEAKKKAEEVKLRLEKNEFNSVYGPVSVRVNGNKKVLAIDIAEEALDPSNKLLLQDKLITAINNALETAGKSAEAEMAAITKGILPGM